MKLLSFVGALISTFVFAADFSPEFDFRGVHPGKPVKGLHFLPENKAQMDLTEAAIPKAFKEAAAQFSRTKPAEGALAFEDVAEKLKQLLRTESYLAYAALNNRLAGGATLGAGAVDELLRLHELLSQKLVAIVSTGYDWQLAERESAQKFSSVLVKITGFLFPTCESGYGNTSPLLEDNIGYFRALATASENSDFGAWVTVLSDHGDYYEQLGDLSSCLNAAKISSKRIASVAKATHSISDSKIRARAEKRLSDLLDFGSDPAAGKCMCLSFEETKSAVDLVNASLKAENLALKTALTPTSHVFGKEKCLEE